MQRPGPGAPQGASGRGPRATFTRAVLRGLQGAQDLPLKEAAPPETGHFTLSNQVMLKVGKEHERSWSFLSVCPSCLCHGSWQVSWGLSLNFSFLPSGPFPASTGAAGWQGLGRGGRAGQRRMSSSLLGTSVPAPSSHAPDRWVSICQLPRRTEAPRDPYASQNVPCLPHPPACPCLTGHSRDKVASVQEKS